MTVSWESRLSKHHVTTEPFHSTDLFDWFQFWCRWSPCPVIEWSWLQNLKDKIKNGEVFYFQSLISTTFLLLNDLIFIRHWNLREKKKQQTSSQVLMETIMASEGVLCLKLEFHLQKSWINPKVHYIRNFMVKPSLVMIHIVETMNKTTNHMTYQRQQFINFITCLQKHYIAR